MKKKGICFLRIYPEHIIQDDVFARLLTFPNVMITGHQAFFTQEAMGNIAQTTLSNIAAFEHGQIPITNCVPP